MHYDYSARVKELEEGDKVFAKNYLAGQRWIAGVIERKTGPVFYQVKMVNGQSWRCHADQLKHRFSEGSTPEEIMTDEDGIDIGPIETTEDTVVVPIPFPGEPTHTRTTNVTVTQRSTRNKCSPHTLIPGFTN